MPSWRIARNARVDCFQAAYRAGKERSDEDGSDALSTPGSLCVMLLLRRGALKGIGRASAEDADAVGGGGDGPMGWWQRLVVVRVAAVDPHGGT